MSFLYSTSGRAPGGLTLDLLYGEGYSVDNMFPVNHGHGVTVPGAAAAWCDTVEKFGSGRVGGELFEIVAYLLKQI